MVQNILKPMSSHNYGTAATEAGNLPVQPYNAEADEINVAASGTSVVVLASNSSRTGATFWNNSTSMCYITLGGTSSTSVYTAAVGPGAVYQLPGSWGGQSTGDTSDNIYTGVVSAIWTTATGSLQGTAF